MAMQFAIASSQYLTTASAPVTALPITVACRFNLPSLSNSVLFSLNGTSGDFDRLQLASSVAGAFESYSVFGNTATFSSVGSYSANTWNQAVGVYQTANKRAFLNGVGGTAETSAYTPPGSGQVVIGARRSSAGFGVFCDGAIAEAAVWNAALAADEIAALSAGFTPDQVRPQSLVFYAPLVRELRDLRGGLMLTNNNGAVVANHPRVIQ